MKNFINQIIKKYKIDKKMSKLKRDPHLFFRDLFYKYLNSLFKILPISLKGQNHFTVVTAVYNAEKYLDDFFESIIGQSLSFRHHIQIICVDDGSTDESAKIIAKWIKKYPHNIQYFYKENGGQSSARNLGLNYVKTQWVTFTDPDDFLHKNYFLNLDKKISLNKNVKMLVAHLIFYFEKEQHYKDTHPLKFRFNEKEVIFDLKDWKHNINLSTAATVFDMNVIRQHQLLFDERVKPNFEDGKFIADFSLLQHEGKICFLKEVIYYYRKRADSSSTIDTSWENIGKFDNVLRYGHLAMLQNYKQQLGSVPGFIQRTTLYDIAWYVKYLVNDESKTAHLNSEQKDTFFNLLREIFQYIDVQTIHSFNLAGIWFKQKVAILGLFKDEKITSQIVYVENFDKENKQLKFSFFSHFDVNFACLLNGKEVLPSYYKKVKNSFVGQNFVDEHIIWIPYQDSVDRLEIVVNGTASRLSLKGKHHKKIIVNDVFKALQNYKDYSNDGSWVLLDRDTQADDNAEHLYRYIQKNQLKNDCYFALRKESRDWERLKNEGFNLLDFGSKEFEEKLKSCNKVISSHLDKYVNNYFGDEYGYTKKFIFLQHGITKDDLSSWFNTKKNLLGIITATKEEHKSIAYNSKYRMTEKEVILTGFPRHDALVEDHSDEKMILIMPTWRNHLVGNTIGLGDERPFNSDFLNSEYARCWKALLNDSKLKELVELDGYLIVFAPHANIVPYINDFEIPSHINVWYKNNSDLSIQDLFKSARLLITDYSSVAFEIAYLGKQTIYYQFDAHEFFSGKHTYQKGYFEYEQHGFGPVVYEHDDVMKEVMKLVENNGQIFDEYLERIEKTFSVRDQNNCKRVYDHLVAMDEYQEVVLERDSVLEFIERAWSCGDLASLKVRIEYLKQHYPNDFLLEKYQSIYQYLCSLEGLHLPTQEEAHIFIDALAASEILNLALKQKNTYQFGKQQIWTQLNEQDQDFHFVFSLLNEEKLSEFIEVFEEILTQKNGYQKIEIERFNLDFWYLDALVRENQFEKVQCYLQSICFKLRNDEFYSSVLELKFKIATQLEDWKSAVALYVEAEEKNLSAFMKQNVEQYAVALAKMDQFKTLEVLINDALEHQSDSLFWLNAKIKMLEHKKNYSEIYQLSEQRVITLNDDNKYAVLKSYYVHGEFQTARQLLIEPTYKDDFDYWLLAWEIALQEKDEILDTYCRKHIWAYYSEQLQVHLPRINLMLEMLTHNNWRKLAS